MPKPSVREVIAVVTIVALATVWAVDHWRGQQAIARAREEARIAQVTTSSLTVKLNGLGYLVDVGQSGEARITRDETFRQGDGVSP